MKGKGTRYSAIDFYAHRFRRAVKSLDRKGESTLDAFSKLKSQHQREVAKLSRSLLSFVVATAAAVASSDTGSLEIKTAFASFSIPSVYIVFAASVFWYSTCISILKFTQFLAFLNAFKNQHGRFKVDYEMLSFLKGVDMDDFLAPPSFDRFLKPSKPMFFLRLFFFGIALLALLIPAFWAWFAVAGQSAISMQGQSAAPLAIALQISSIGLLVFPTLFVASAFLRTRSTKQVEMIRWSFLYPLLKDREGNHPQLSRWLPRADDRGE